MGHKISKEQIDPGVKDYIMSFVGDVADLETEVNTDIISAVNSLMVDRVDNIESIGKLAEAIGEPVTASDSIDEVVDKVDGLVTDFKSKVLNAGILYESGDRFKELIEKLEGLVAGEGGGIQISTGHFDITTLQPASEVGFLTSNQLNFNPPLNFTPDRVILSIPKLQLGTSVGGDYANHSIDSEIHRSLNNRFTVYDVDGKEIDMYIGTVTNDITAEGFVLYAGKNNTNYALTTPEGIDWLAIGVGEGQEDNTLLETLKGILEEEQVEVSDEDTMADLIIKVDAEFADKNNEISNLETELAGKVAPAGDAVASDVLSGKTFINSTGKTVTGTMANRGGAQTVTPGTSNKTLNAGYYNGNITVKGDSNLVASNIVSGKSIFGVTGNATIESLGGKVSSRIIAGSSYTFILKNDGTLLACGTNHRGELGGYNGSNSPYIQITYDSDFDYLPSIRDVIPGGDTYKSINYSGTSYSYDYTFIISTDNRLWATGGNDFGQLGIGTSGTDIKKFTKVDITDVKQVVCCLYSTYVLKNDGTLWACGLNCNGQLGLGDSTNRSTFTQVTTNVDNIAYLTYFADYDVYDDFSVFIYNPVIVKNDGTVWMAGKFYDHTIDYNNDNNVTYYTTFTQILSL